MQETLEQKTKVARQTHAKIERQKGVDWFLRWGGGVVFLLDINNFARRMSKFYIILFRCLKIFLVAGLLKSRLIVVSLEAILP